MFAKYITLSYCLAGISFILTPLVFYALRIPNSEWMQPVTIRMFFTNNKSHPGYEINYVYSASLVNYFTFMAAGDIYNNERAIDFHV